jgi:hypothetical protein
VKSCTLLALNSGSPQKPVLRIVPSRFDVIIDLQGSRTIAKTPLREFMLARNSPKAVRKEAHWKAGTMFLQKQLSFDASLFRRLRPRVFEASLWDAGGFQRFEFNGTEQQPESAR